MADPRSLPLRSHPAMRALLLLLLLWPVSASAERIPGAKKSDVEEIPLRLSENRLHIDPMRRSAPWPPPTPEKPASDVVPGRLDPGPWTLFEKTFDEAGCHSPRLSRDGAVALAKCPGADISRPEDEHVFYVRHEVLGRYRNALAPDSGPVALDGDGTRLALIVEEANGGRSVHLLDFETQRDVRISGGWRDPGAPVLASDANVVAFPAKVGGQPAAVVVDLAAGKAVVARRNAGPVRVWGLDQKGRHVLLTSDTNDASQLMLVDVQAGKTTILSARNAAVTSAALHPSGDAVGFAAELGGLGVLYWADLASSNRTELRTSTSSRYVVLGIDKGRRQLLYEETGQEQPYRLFDRRKKTDRYTVIKGCVEPAISEDGRLMAVRCPKARKGAAVYLFGIPEPED
jgi:hypothetical protein